MPKILHTPHMAILRITMRETRFSYSVKRASQIITPSIKFKPSASAQVEHVVGRKKSQTGVVSMETPSR